MVQPREERGGWGNKGFSPPSPYSLRRKDKTRQDAATGIGKSTTTVWVKSVVKDNALVIFIVFALVRFVVFDIGYKNRWQGFCCHCSYLDLTNKKICMEGEAGNTTDYESRMLILTLIADEVKKVRNYSNGLWSVIYMQSFAKTTLVTAIPVVLVLARNGVVVRLRIGVLVTTLFLDAHFSSPPRSCCCVSLLSSYLLVTAV